VRDALEELGRRWHEAVYSHEDAESAMSTTSMRSELRRLMGPKRLKEALISMNGEVAGSGSITAGLLSASRGPAG